ncbi:MAG: hypothetical protein IPJ40_11690 [Saprospirales bacterium]|nr:hypothetical protein [Saprospirales bacterium]
MKFSPIPLVVALLMLAAVSADGQLIYSISADFPFYRSQMIRFFSTGGLQSTDHIQGQNPNTGIGSLVKNVKGICRVTNTGTSADGKYYVTTGMFNDDPYFDAQLFEIDPNSSSANLLVPPVVAAPGTIRDICFIGTFSGIQAGIYGIRGGIELVRFNFSGGVFSPPVSVGFFTSALPVGYTAWGLSWTLCAGQPELLITARGQPNLVKYYQCDPNTAALTFIGDILPTAPAVFSFANCGIGWFASTDELWINGIDNTTNSQPVYKYNQSAVVPWCPGTAPLITSTNLPFSGRNVEDFCTELY